MLPTDERYRALSDLQVGVLFSNWLFSMPEGDLWRAYWADRKSKVKPKVNVDDLRVLGYPEAEIAVILKELGQ